MADQQGSHQEISDQQIMANWYQFEALQPGSIGPSLRVYREREGLTEAEQQSQLLITEPASWIKLQAMHLPREWRESEDVKQILAALNLSTNPDRLKQMLLSP